LASLLSSYTDSRDNNFNLIRFIAASLVLFGHCYPLSGISQEPLSQYGISLGHLSVDVFFITSGFLVTRSLVIRQDLISFAMARILRIFPALIVAVLFSVFVVGLYFTTLPAQEYLTHSAIYTYLFNNTTLVLQPTAFALPYVFDTNPYKQSVNGSLWTLPWEMNMYVLLAMLGSLVFIKPSFFSLRVFKWILVGIVGISFPLYVVNYIGLFSTIPFFTMGTHFLTTFFMGAILFVFQDRIYLSKRLFGICLLLIFYTASYKSIFFPVYNLVLGYIVLYLAYVPNGFIRNFNKLGDYSYGVYIYAFPIQQSIIALIPNISVMTFFVYSFSITLIFAIFSWHFIEKPALKLKVT
jgi:peptidoglycan/LPS O-acetylase OafA/YrhL